MGLRRLAREISLKTLFQAEYSENPQFNQIYDLVKAHFLNEDPSSIEFSKAISQGTLEKKDELIEKIQNLAPQWRVSRMSVTDRILLMLGSYELLYIGTEPAIVINEYIEIAKKYSTEESPKFINGILDELVKRDGLGQNKS